MAIRVFLLFFFLLSRGEEVEVVLGLLGKPNGARLVWWFLSVSSSGREQLAKKIGQNNAISQ